MAPPFILYLDPARTTSIDVTGPMADAFIVPAPITNDDLEDAVEASSALRDFTER